MQLNDIKISFKNLTSHFNKIVDGYDIEDTHEDDIVDNGCH